MEEFRFPFPGRDLADVELTYDLCYDKIPEKDRPVIVENAWKKGVRAAEAVFVRENGQSNFVRIIDDAGLKLVEKNVDYVVGNQRYFSDYISGRKIINLYTKSVQLWADENKLTYKQAVNLILSHEYYHYLEMNEIGLTSKDYLVPVIRLGSFAFGKTGIRALSEIAAHAFARRYHELLEESESQHG